VPICHVLQLWKRDAKNIKDYHTQQSSNMKLFGAYSNVQPWQKHKAVISECEVSQKKIHLTQEMTFS
jgi:hypothetical protein